MNVLPSEVNPIIVDIETTGLTATSQITAIGIVHDTEYTVLFNGTLNASTVETELRTHSDVSDTATLTAISHDTERQLLLDFERILDEIIVEDTDVITFFNGYHTYKQSFDYPMLQTRAFANNTVNPLKNKPLFDISTVIENVSILKTESITVEDAFKGRGGLNKSPVIQFADELEQYYTEYLYEKYDELEIESARKQLIEDDVDVSELSSTELTEIEAHGLLVQNWSTGSTKSDVVDALETVEPIFQLEAVDEFIINWFDENDFETPLKDPSSLSEIYDVLKSLRGVDSDSIDPLDSDGEKAVEAFEEERYDDLIRHLLNDLVMTRYITEFGLDACVCSDFHVKTV
jgi:hypothetical protein